MGWISVTGWVVGAVLLVILAWGISRRIGLPLRTELPHRVGLSIFVFDFRGGVFFVEVDSGKFAAPLLN